MRKIKVAMDLSSSKMGGPYMSTMNIMNSSLKNCVDFVPFEYDISIGRGVSWKRIKDIQRKIEAINPDIVHFSGLQLSGFHIAVAARLAKAKRLLVTVHGSSLEAINFQWHKRLMMFVLECLTICLSSACYGVSRYSSQLLVPRLFRKKNKGYIYNFSTSKYLSDLKISRKDLGFADDEVIVTSVARITEEKGYAILADAIIADKDSPIKYLIVGDGSYLPTMKRRISEAGLADKVVFTGYANDVGSYLSISDIFVLPTLHETLSISLLEAARARLPLIASRVGGVPEIIDDGVNGYLFNPGDALEFLDRIKDLSQSPDLRHAMGAKAREKIDTAFNDEVISNQILDLYNSLMQNGGEK